MVNYKKKYEALKSQNNIDKKIPEHKKKHIHILLLVKNWKQKIYPMMDQVGGL